MFHFPGFASYAYLFSIRFPDFTQGGLPHSDSHGSTLARSSPWIFVACHVLLRLLMPWHPPYALPNLTLTLFPSVVKEQKSDRDLRIVIYMFLYLLSLSESGGGERDRTDDLLLAKQALSQLSYTPHFLKTPKTNNQIPKCNMFGIVIWNLVIPR